MESIFKDLTVVDLTSVLAGPAVGNFFSELGAEVIKIENKTRGGDITRNWRQPKETPEGPSAYYASVNWNKKSRFLDLSAQDDRKEINRLLKDADIVITNFKKGDDTKFGLTYEHVKAINASIIYGKITGFGSKSDRLAYDLILQAETGFMSMNGEPGGPPTKMPLALIDLLAAHQLKEGILCALLKQKESPNQPFKVEVSLYNSAIASLINQATNWLMNGNIPQRMGSKHPNIAPYGEIFTTRDNRLVTLAIGSDRQFKDLCSILVCEELPRESRYASNISRVKHRERLADTLQEYIQRWEAPTLLEQCRKARVPAAEIKNLKQVFESETARQLLLRQEMEGRQTVRPRTTVFKLRS